MIASTSFVDGLQSIEHVRIHVENVVTMMKISDLLLLMEGRKDVLGSVKGGIGNNIAVTMKEGY